MKSNHVLLIVLALLSGLLIFSISTSSNKTQTLVTSTPSPTIAVDKVESTSSSDVLGQATKTANCVSANALPDKDCSPGAVFPDVTADQVCVSGYSASVRDVSTSTKNKVFAEYNVVTHPTGAYEVDHLISLELGGSNDIANLWPEPASPTPGFHEKDKVENYLHNQVCKGLMTLKDAQYKIANDWLSVFNQI